MEGWVYLEATGPPKPALISQYSWQVGMNGTRVRIPKLAAGTTWSFKPIGITCSIGETTVVCVNRSGHGFTLSADNYTEQ
ncbi:MAG: hypothetical protein JST59_09435 [Actinobacteria bacterium]|nr:hypothetical protein [Actinomycetota bacterium]